MGGGKKKDRVAGQARRATKTKPVARGPDSEGEESETSAMSYTSSDKRHLAKTREELREAGAQALRLAAAHETLTESPTIGPGNIFDDGDDDDDDDDDETETLRETIADLKLRLRKYN